MAWERFEPNTGSPGRNVRGAVRDSMSPQLAKIDMTSVLGKWPAVQVGMVRDTLSVSSTGVKIFSPVPVGQRWLVHGVDVLLSTGVWTMREFYVSSPVGGMMLIKTATGETSHRFWVRDIPMEPGWTFQIWVDTYTSTGNAMITALVSIMSADAA